MLTKKEFQLLLQQFGPPLDKCQVKPASDNVFCPEYLAKVCMAITIYGEPKWVEAEVDMRGMNEATDVLNFAGKLLQAFEKADEQARAAG